MIENIHWLFNFFITEKVFQIIKDICLK